MITYFVDSKSNLFVTGFRKPTFIKFATFKKIHVSEITIA